MTMPVTDELIHAIERVIDRVVSGDRGPNPGKLPLSLARSAVVDLLRKRQLPIPDRDWLNNGIRTWAAFNEVELDEAKPAQADFFER
jgi:hypothetical protein